MTSDAANDTVMKHDSSERDRLARERTSLANERTFLSYARTAIMLFASGATVVKLFPSSFFHIALGVVLVGFSFLTLVMGVFRYRRMKKIIPVE